MAINADKPHLWKVDIAKSVDYYNDWFMSFAPKTYRNQREEQTALVEQTMSQTDNLQHISPTLLKERPLNLQMLRMATAPPLARDRLIGLAYVTKNLVYSMEETNKHEPRVPPRMPKDQLQEELERLCEVIEEMIDRDICPWLETGVEPEKEEIRRAASVFADRLCGMATDPIIRNAQEREQKEVVREWLTARDYKEVDSSSISNVLLMNPGTFTFGCTVQVPVGDKMRNLPVDCIIKPHRLQVGDVPIFFEMKSAGDYTNPNKRQKEEAQKARQLRDKYGDDTLFILFLRGYFNSQYLGYEAAEGIDWIWEHRVEDLVRLDLDKGDSDRKGTDDDGGSGPEGEGPCDKIEKKRVEIQENLDREKSQEERNRLGQFSTPMALANEIIQVAKSFLPQHDQIDFLEPAIGTGSFLSALLRNLDRDKVGRCQGYEIDPRYAEPTRKLWEDAPLDLEIADFTLLTPPESEADRFDLIATNPPYVRHHHIRAVDKSRLKADSVPVIGTEPSGLSGLYTYFVYLAHLWLREGGIGAWLIPSEFMYVNYGSQLREYLLNKVTLLRVHRFDPQEIQFTDALVSSSVVLLRKEKSQESHKVLFSYGRSLTEPDMSRWIPIEELKKMSKWRNLYKAPAVNREQKEGVRLGDIFSVVRGLATGANRFFIMKPEEAKQNNLPSECLKPILPSPRYLNVSEIESKDSYMPDIREKRVLLFSDLPEEEIAEQYPALWAYLQKGKQEGIHKRYLCSHRSPWYSQEEREPAPILCSYMGRSSNGENPFRFILNKSAAVAPNTYLNLYPTQKLQMLLNEQPDLLRKIFDALYEVTAENLIHNGRTYGGGLHKIEPKELENVRIHVEELAEFIEEPRQGVLPTLESESA